MEGIFGLVFIPLRRGCSGQSPSEKWGLKSVARCAWVAFCSALQIKYSPMHFTLILLRYAHCLSAAPSNGSNRVGCRRLPRLRLQILHYLTLMHA